MKTCTRCNELKPLSEFYKHVRDGVTAGCKKCINLQKARRIVELKLSGRYKKKYRWRKERLRQNKIKIKTTLEETRRNGNLRRRYGISLKQYNDMLSKQNGVCAICESKQGKRRLHVDHCHKTGKVRELLCSNCNTTLGKVKYNIDTLRNLISYIERHS